MGMYDPATRTIYIDRDLPVECNGTRRSALEHEKVHARLHAAELTIVNKAEENLACLVSVCSTPIDYQTKEEAAFKAVLCGKKSWARKKDRAYILKRCCALAGVHPAPKLIKALACHTGCAPIK